MGRIWCSRLELVTTISEIVGYKAGLALDDDELRDHIPNDFHDRWSLKDDVAVGIRSEEFEDLVAGTLHAVGYTKRRRSPFSPLLELTMELRDNPHAIAILQDISEQFVLLVERSLGGPGRKQALDPTPLIDLVRNRHGPEGVTLAILFLERTNEAVETSPWSELRRVEWSDVAALNDLFESEGISPSHGEFIDQRFVDYLEANTNKLSTMNWRKFEALTCEFFEKAGFKVEIGPGRNDGGVDGRVWRPEPTPGEPPLLLIQCKRQKADVEAVVVKALWADVKAENAGGGLVVTTSRLAKGAREVAHARGYSVTEADRPTIVRWLQAMRSPGTGVFMGS